MEKTMLEPCFGLIIKKLTSLKTTGSDAVNRARVLDVIFINTMQKTFLIIISVFVFMNSAYAENLCPVNEEIAEDMRIEESYFTKERAVNSASYLKDVVEGNANYEWFSVPNSMKIINGYFLKYDYLNEKNQCLKENKLSLFYKFMKNEARWYD